MTARAHHFTVDVEESFHSTALAGRIPREQWDALPRRSPEVVAWLLDRLAERGSHATFFILGWLAEREPGMVRAIAEAGHEVAGHSWDHRRVDEQTPEAFRASMRRTKAFLEQLCGQEVVGFRAPSFSITPGCEWAFDVLLEEGYRYDSSLFPIAVHPGYGYPAAPPDPHPIKRPAGTLLEVPPLTLSLLGRRLPAAGGAYLRFFPAALPLRALAQTERRGHPGTLYIHPWDLDPEPDPLPLPPLLRLRLHGGRRRARARVERILTRVPSRSIRESLLAGAPS